VLRFYYCKIRGDSLLKVKPGTILSFENFNESSQPIIVGIDPGTTTGIAILNLDGEIISTFSKRNFSKADIIEFISNFGRPIVIATDMNPPPETVEKLATSLPAKLFYPDSTLKRKEKSKLIRKLEVRPNRHEKDALAAAIYSYKRLKPIINKVEQKMKAYTKDEIRREVVKRIFRIKDISTIIKRNRKI